MGDLLTHPHAHPLLLPLLLPLPLLKDNARASRTTSLSEQIASREAVTIWRTREGRMAGGLVGGALDRVTPTTTPKIDRILQ